MAIIKSTWISYSVIANSHFINSIITNWNETIWQISASDCWFYTGKVNALADYAPPGWVYNNGGTNAITDGQRPALYLIKQTINRFYLFFLTSVKVQYGIQRN